MRKRSQKGAVVFTAVVLVLLVVVSAWTWKKRGQEPVPETVTQEPEQKKPEKQTEEQPVAEEPAEKPGLSEEERKAKALADFQPDYTSAPLLNTTAIKSLSVEIGTTEDELRFNWLSPGGSKGKVEWKDAEGKVEIFEAQMFQSTTVPGYSVNKAAVSGLQPGTTYTYRVGSNDAWSPEYSYKTPEAFHGEMTFLVTSDAQVGQAELEDPLQTAERWDSVLNRLNAYVPESRFLFHLGDQVADFGSQEHYDMFLDHLALYRTPLVPVVGNHDIANEYSMEENEHPGGRYFYEHFNVPNLSDVGRTPYDLDGCYSFVRGNALFIVLNSNTPQPVEVLEQYVARAVRENPHVKWRILAQHHAPYSSVAKYQVRTYVSEYLARAAIDNDIDLVLTGHDHIYSRSAFVNRELETLNDYDYETGGVVTNPEGTLYVTCGTSSGCLYQEVEPEIRLVCQNQPRTPVALRIDLTDTELHLKAYEVDSWTMFDEYTIQKE